MEMKNLVKIERHNGNGYVVSSRVIAKGLGKRHSHIKESIENIKKNQSAEISAHLNNLIFSNEYKDSKNRTYREYLLTKDGFILYMFNIQGHIDFKMAYINEFNRMERELNRQKLLPVPQDKIMIPLDKARYWARIKELSDKADEIRSTAYKKMCQLSKDLANLTNNVDDLSSITFEVEELLNKIENWCLTKLIRNSGFRWNINNNQEEEMVKEIMKIKAKSPMNLMREIKEFVGAKKFLMHRNKIVLDDNLKIYYEKPGNEYIVKKVEG